MKINQIICRYSKCLSIAALAGAFLISSEMPLLASPQSGQSSTPSQKSDDSLPDAPQPQSAQTSQQSTQAPSGAAGAKAANAKGAPVAQPIGAAVAPVRQHGHRSLLIKIGLIAGGAVAIGTVVALSEKSPTRPSGTASPASGSSTINVSR
jgi:hypothetical protein